jgi:hypothetical protein
MEPTFSRTVLNKKSIVINEEGILRENQKKKKKRERKD